MYSLRAFIQIPALVSNQPGIVSPIGELSAKSKTFSREVGIYRVDDYPNTMLHSFSSVQDDQLVPVDYMVSSAILQVADFLYLRSIDGTLSDDRSHCQQLLLTTFGTTIQFGLVGRMVTNGNYWIPETLTITLIGQGENEIRLWFSDAAFRGQYDRYEIVVVPPVPNLNDLHGQRAVVLAMLSALTIPDHVAKVQELTTQFAQTHLVSTNYDWTDKNDSAIKQPTPWTVIVYGAAGNNDDLIREALVEYILANSTWPRSEWEKIYPDLFLPLEFYITPLWDRYSLTNMLTIAGVHSPTVPWREGMRYALGTFYNESFQHCSEWTAISQSTYKSLSFVSIGNSKNRNGVFGFEVLWPKYAALSSMHGDFGRMPTETQQFSLLLTELLIIAETMTATSEIPQGYSRVKRGGYSYLAKSFEKVQYLVWLKFNDFPEVEVPELPNFGQYRLTLSVTGAPGEQTIQATVSQDGTPGPISPAIPIDWFVTGDWFTTELQDGDSTQSIPAIVTATESGSGVHTVRAEFIGATGAVELTGTVALLPAPAASNVFSLRLQYTPANLLIAEILRDGEILMTEEEERSLAQWGPSEESIIEGEATFTAVALPDTSETDYVVSTLLSRFGLVIDNAPIAGNPERTVSVTFTPRGGQEITLTETINTPNPPAVLDSTIDWQIFGTYVDTTEVEHVLKSVRLPADEVIGGYNVVNWHLWLSDGRLIRAFDPESGWLLHEVTFRHTDETKMLMQIGVNEGGGETYYSESHVWGDFTTWQN